MNVLLRKTADYVRKWKYGSMLESGFWRCHGALRGVWKRLLFIFSKLIPDKIYIEYKYKRQMGEKLNLKNPVTFNEKINWLKLYDRKDIYTKMADKYAVREIIREKLGEEYLIPLLGVWERVEDIDFSVLPNQFVLKCTHDSASVIICRNKAELDKAETIRRLKRLMNINYYWYSREWIYKDIKPKIIAEKYMADESGKELKDYKVYNFNGIPQLIQVDFGRFTHHERNLYTTDWKFIDEQIEYPKNPKVKIKCPEQIELMLQLASKLSGDVPFMRTDFYSIDSRVYFGEITFYPEAGFATFESKNFEKKLGEMIRI